MWEVRTRFGRVLCRVATKERAETWRLHYEDAYGMYDLIILEVKDAK